MKGVRMAERTQSRSVPLWETWTFDVCKPFCSPVGVSPNKCRDGSSLDPRQVWGRLIHETAGGGGHRLLVPSKATPLLQHPTTPLFSHVLQRTLQLRRIHRRWLLASTWCRDLRLFVRLNSQAVPLRTQIADRLRKSEISRPLGPVLSHPGLNSVRSGRPPGEAAAPCASAGAFLF